MIKQPTLSIIITSFTTERLKNIFELLDSIKNQTFPKIETIFIAESSRELYKKVKAYSEKNGIRNFKLVFNENEHGLAASRNLGTKYATGDIFSFIDDDVLLFTDWAEMTVKTYTDDSIIGVTSATIPLWEDNSMSWFP